MIQQYRSEKQEMSQKHSVYSIFDLQKFALEHSNGNLRIFFTTDDYTLVMSEVINVISPYEVTSVSVKPYGNFEKHTWDTDMPYMKYQELLCDILDHLEKVEEEYYEEMAKEQKTILQ